MPLAGLLQVAEPPVAHGEEEPVVAIAALAEVHRRLQRNDRRLPAAGPVERRPQCVWVVWIRWIEFRCFRGQFYSSLWISEPDVCGRGQQPGELVVCIGGLRIELYGLAVTGGRLVQLPLRAQKVTSPVPALCTIRLQLDEPGEVGGGM